MTTRLTRLAQLRSISHALIFNFAEAPVKKSKLIRFGSLHFRDNWGWPCTAVHLWLFCSNRKLYHKNDLFTTVTTHNNIFCHRLSDHLHCTNCPFTSHMYNVEETYGYTLPVENIHCLEKIFSTKYAKTAWTVLFDWSFVIRALQYFHLLTVPWSCGKQRFVWSICLFDLFLICLICLFWYFCVSFSRLVWNFNF